jgi:beta-galactosidase
LLSLLSISYEFIDIRNEPIKQDKPLIVFSLDFMDNQTQKKIADFIENGGRVLMGPFMPLKGLDAKKADYLKSRLGIKADILNSRYIKKSKDFLMIEEPNYALNRKGKFKSIFRDKAGNNLAISFKHNKGRAIIYGFGLISMFDYYQDMFLSLLKGLNLKRKVTSSSALLPAVFRSSHQGGFLFAANYHQIPLEGFYEIYIEKKGSQASKVRVPKKGTMKLNPRTDKILPVNLKLNDNLTVISSTAQILKIAEVKSSLKLDLELIPDCPQELVIKSKKNQKVYLEKRLIKKLKANRQEVIDFSSAKKTASIIIK